MGEKGGKRQTREKWSKSSRRQDIRGPEKLDQFGHVLLGNLCHLFDQSFGVEVEPEAPQFGHNKAPIRTQQSAESVRQSARNIEQRGTAHRHSTRSQHSHSTQSPHSHRAVTVTTNQHGTSSSVTQHTAHSTQHTARGHSTVTVITNHHGTSGSALQTALSRTCSDGVGGSEWRNAGQHHGEVIVLLAAALHVREHFLRRERRVSRLLRRPGALLQRVVQLLELRVTVTATVRAL